MVKTIKEKIIDHFNKYKDSKSLKNRLTIDGKKVDIMGIAKGKLFEMNGKFYPIYNSTGTLSKARKSKDFKKYEKALKENPSREQYIKIATEVDKTLTEEVAGALYDFANNKEMKLNAKDQPKPQTNENNKKPIQKAEEENLVSKDRATKPGIENIANRNLYVDRIRNAEFGIYWNGQIYPVFKDVKTNIHKNTWSLVRSKRTQEEKELFLPYKRTTFNRNGYKNNRSYMRNQLNY